MGYIVPKGHGPIAVAVGRIAVMRWLHFYIASKSLSISTQISQPAPVIHTGADCPHILRDPRRLQILLQYISLNKNLQDARFLLLNMASMMQNYASQLLGQLLWFTSKNVNDILK